jgi:hypothetical protein
MSIKLTDTQLVMLSAAAQRKDRCLVASPKGGAALKVATKLISAGFVEEAEADAGTSIWRRDNETSRAYAPKLTAVGAKAIGLDDGATHENTHNETGALEKHNQATVSSEVKTVEAPQLSESLVSSIST